MISANPKVYDHAGAFRKLGFIDWHHTARYAVGDTVYIYCSAPYQRVMYETVVEKESMPFSEVSPEDREFKLVPDPEGGQEDRAGRKYARLRLLRQADREELSLPKLQENGLLRAPLGPIRISRELAGYISRCFDDAPVSAGQPTALTQRETESETHAAETGGNVPASSSPHPEQQQSTPQPQQKSKTGIYAIAGIAVAVIVGGGAFFAMGGKKKSPEPSPQPPAAQKPAEAAKPAEAPAASGVQENQAPASTEKAVMAGRKAGVLPTHRTVAPARGKTVPPPVIKAKGNGLDW